MKITPELIRHLEDLARIALSDEERKSMQKDLEKILGYFEKLGELDLEGVPELVRPVAIENRMRPDEPRPGLGQEDALKNAPEQEDGYFKVPRAIE